MKTDESIANSSFRKCFSVLFFLFLSILSVQLAAQVDTGNKSKEKKNNPDVNIKVNKELDNNGNVIRYDSTYTWSWSSDSDQSFPQEYFNDSMSTDFFKPFEKNFFFGNNNVNPFGFTEDSLFNQLFLSPDIDMMQKQMQEMMIQQQKMMEEFFGQPPTVPVPEENKNNDQKNVPAQKTAGSIDI